MAKLKIAVATMLIGAGSNAYAQQQTADTQTLSSKTLQPVFVFGELNPYFEQENDTALKGAVDQNKVPFTTNVLNSQVIEDLQAKRLEDVFEYIPSFSSSGTAANSFTIRGQSADLQNLQVNGLPGLTSRFGSPVTANIEKVEVIKGPASVLYGWMDPGGMVNMITKKPVDDEFTEMTVSGQTFPDYGDNGYAFSIDSNGLLNNKGDLQYRLVAGYENEDSFRDYVKDQKAWYLFPSLSWVPSDEQRLDIQLEYTEERRAADDGLFVLDHDINKRADITTYYQEPGDTDEDFGVAFNLAYTDQLRDDVKLNTKWRSVYHEDESDAYESNAVQNDDTLRRRNRHQYNERQYHFFDANLDIDVDAILPQKWTVGLGGGYEYRQYDRLAFDTRGANVSLINPVYTGDVLADDKNNFRDWDLYNAGIYAQDQISVTDKLSLLLGARYDTQWGDYHLHFPDASDGTDNEESVFVATQAYNLGLTYQVVDQVAVYASMSQSFNPQSIPTFDANNDQLDPERGIQYEIGTKLNFLDDTLNANVSAYSLRKENVSETVNGTPQLVGTVESVGSEVQIQYQPSPNWQFQASHAYTLAEVAETTNRDAYGHVPKFVPKHTASFLARYNYPDEVYGGLVGMGMGYRFQSARYTDEEASKRVRLPSYSVFDLNFYYELETMKLSLNVDNVFDQVYFDGGSNDNRIDVGDPRKVTLTAKWTF